MTIFSLIWIIVVVGAFTRKDIKYMVFVTLLFMTFQCDNVIAYGGISVGPQLATSFVFIIKVLVQRRGKIIYNKNFRKIIIVSVILLTTAMASCIYNGTLSDKALYILQLFIYILTFLLMLTVYKGIGQEDLYDVLRKITVILLVIGLIQMLTTSGILPLRPVMKVLFYNDSSSTVAFNKSGSFSRIMSTFMEPSYFAGFLVGAFYYFLSIREKWNENIVLMIAIFFEIILTVSSTAYAAFGIVGILFLMFQKTLSFKYKIGILCLALVGFLVVYFGFYNYLDTAIISKTSSSSFIVRSNMNKSAFSAFEGSKLIGVGYKSVRGSSIIYTLLGSMGIIGLTAYFLFNFTLLAPTIIVGRKLSEMQFGILFTVMSAVACQIISCPDLDLCTYWFWIYAFGVSYGIYALSQ